MMMVCIQKTKKKKICFICILFLEKVCTDDLNKNSNLIPIIVGACLAALVVIVLIAYLLGRRRSRNGYQSV
jgi:predicted permease